MDVGRELEAMLSELETWAPTETDGELAQGRIDWLDEVGETFKLANQPLID